MPPIPTEQEQRAGFQVANAIEELRDLVTAVEWLLLAAHPNAEYSPSGLRYAGELRRVQIRLESAKELIAKSDVET